tara:strand:+ start:37805 stop:38014 length:210 start_codon:yes stop_codon:yes gene_type:complete
MTAHSSESLVEMMAQMLAADAAQLLSYQNKCKIYSERLRKEGESIAFLLSLLDDALMQEWRAYIGGEPQ